MSADTLSKHFLAGPATDEPGNCKLCGTLIEIPGVNVMTDPDGKGTAIDFCSAECLDSALNIFDHVPRNKLHELRTAIDEVDKSRS